MVNAKTGERLKGELQGREERVVSVRRRFLCCRLIDAVMSKPLQGDNGVNPFAAGSAAAVDPPRRAGDGIRTHDNHVGNVVLYQLSYTRMHTLSVVEARKASPATTENPVSIAREGVVARSADGGIWKSCPEEE